MSKAAKKRKRTPLTEEIKQKISKSNTGKKRSNKTKQKISEALTGKIVTEETRKKMGLFQKGRIKSEIECKNISSSKMGDKNPMYGKTPWNKGLKNQKKNK